MVRAVLIATGYRSELEPLVQHRPTPLFNIADKPIIFYILEFLILRGLRRFDLVLNHMPELIEEKLGTGKRWGIEISYHLAREHDKPFTVLVPAAQGWQEEPIIFGYGDTLPRLTARFFNHIGQTPLLCRYPDKSWTGWALFTTKTLASVSPQLKDPELPKQLNPHANLKVLPFLSAATLRHLKNSNLKFIQRRHAESLFPSTARMVEPGIWISRAVSLHPSVKIHSPVFIGEHCQIKPGVEIGPNTVIENNCIIDDFSNVKNSLVCQSSYVGSRLEISDSIIDRNVLINLTHETKIALHDDFILCGLSPPSHLKWIPLFVFEKFLAITLLILFLPFYLMMLVFANIERVARLSLPNSDDKAEWTEFEMLRFKLTPKQKKSWIKLFYNLPLLINMIKGDIHFVGVAARTKKETEDLPEDWQKLYLKSKVGLITQCSVDTDGAPTPDEQFASESLYTIQMSPWNDFKLALSWLIKKIKKLIFRKTNGKPFNRDPRNPDS